MFYIIFDFREREREGERAQETSVKESDIDGLPSVRAPGNWTCNPGMCPNQQLNWWPFGSQEDAQLTEPCLLGHTLMF